jgi:hypothetical protein
VKYLFRDVVAGMTPVQVVAYNLEIDDTPHTFRNPVAAVEERAVIASNSAARLVRTR